MASAPRPRDSPKRPQLTAYGRPVCRSLVTAQSQVFVVFFSEAIWRVGTAMSARMRALFVFGVICAVTIGLVGQGFLPPARAMARDAPVACPHHIAKQDLSASSHDGTAPQGSRHTGPGACPDCCLAPVWGRLFYPHAALLLRGLKGASSRACVTPITRRTRPGPWRLGPSTARARRPRPSVPLQSSHASAIAHASNHARAVKIQKSPATPRRGGARAAEETSSHRFSHPSPRTRCSAPRASSASRLLSSSGRLLQTREAANDRRRSAPILCARAV